MEPEREEVEQIPWTMLAEQLEGGRRRSVVSIVLAVVAALVAGVIAINVMRRPSGTLLELSPGVSSPGPAPTGAPEPEPHDAAGVDPVAATEAASSQPSLYSEADLMAFLPEQPGILLVTTAAEWFVADYFTVLGADDAVRTASVDLPAPDPGDAGYSWAEWVRAAAIEPLDERRYDVTVLFRTVYRNELGTLVRTPVRRAVVEIDAPAAGSPTVVGLPRLLESPELAADAGGAIVAPPDAIVAVALQDAAEFGQAAELEGAIEFGAGWRVIVSVVDASGVRWPLMFDVVDGD